MKNSLIKTQGILRRFIGWQRSFANSVYKLVYRAKKVGTQPITKNPYLKDRNLYTTKQGERFWLNDTSFVDKYIKDYSVWEPLSTRVIKHYVQSGDVVLDVGANIGYYSVLCSKIVGDSGKVLAFEPTKHFAEICKENIKINELQNVSLFEFGLSNNESCTDIFIGDNSATMHWLVDSPRNGGEPIDKETIRLKTLDSIIDSLNVDKIDFIKVDIDGHEPSFLEGAWDTITKYKPKILLELDHAHYLKAGHTAWDFYHWLKNRGCRIFSEKTLTEFQNLDMFLYECGNFDNGVNILILT